MNLYRDYVDLVVRGIEAAGVQVDPVVKGGDAAVLLAACLEFTSRHISTRPRRVEYSKQIQSSSSWLLHRSDIERLAAASEAGENLVPYQGRKVSVFDRPDRLYLDWGIQHLHLGKLLPGRSLSQGTSELLFALFLDDAAFFIEVYNHKSFSARELLRILDSNWPWWTDRYAVSGAVHPAARPTDVEVHDLRVNHVNAFIEVSPGRVLAPPGGGCTSAGTSVTAMRDAQATLRLLRNAENYVAMRGASIRATLGVSDDSHVYLADADERTLTLSASGTDNTVAVSLSDVING